MLKVAKLKINLIILLYSLFLSASISSQTVEDEFTVIDRHDWQISLGVGLQMSGIKSEDFVSSNYSPLINVTVGKWFTPALAIQIAYKGWYFNTISDEKKHNYGYYYGEAVFNINNLVRTGISSTKWSFYLHVGSGYFYNYRYERPNICANLGVSNNFRLNDKFLAFLNLSAIMGWDIYQGDEDILPAISLGINYLF